MKTFVLIITILLSSLHVFSQYNTHQQLSSRLNALKQKNSLVTISSIAKTWGGNDIPVVSAGKGDINNKPGIAVIGGVHGYSLSSTEIVMQMLEKLTLRPEIMNEVTFYFIPEVSPDAAAQYFAGIKYERDENARPYDDDRDGKIDEDGFDDLNKDGLITWMRVGDTLKGEFIAHPDNPAVMIKADRLKGDKGRYTVIREGFDNDKDGIINEDPPGGVIFNKNFTFNYPYFTQGAGENAVSEEETRGLAKFLFDHWNIYAVLIIGSENNLSGISDLKADLIDKKIPAAVHDADKKYFEAVVNIYNQTVKLNDAFAVNPSGGDLLSWSYYHYNRYAFSTPAWNAKFYDNNMGSREFNYLTWASENNVQNTAVPWQAVSHPDYPGKTVEIGGIKPFLENNPPIGAIDSVSEQHLNFLVELARMHPSLAFGDVNVKGDKNIYTIDAEITNTGRLPTQPNIASSSRLIKKVRLDIETVKDQQVTGGRKVFLYDRIDPGETIKARWLVKGKGRVTLYAGSPQTGFIVKNIDLN